MLLGFIVDYKEMENSLSNVNPIIVDTFREVYTVCCSNAICKIHRIKIDAIVDYFSEELHMGHWSSIPLTIKEAFYTCSFIKALTMLQLDATTPTVLEALKCIDLGILLGSPLKNNRNLLTDSAKYLSRRLVKTSNVTNIATDTNKKRKHEYNPEFDKLAAIQVDWIALPSLECFIHNFYNSQFPVKITESMKHWPAIHKWTDISYILNIAGERTVPIEIGSQYTDENWSQKLMSLREFIDRYYFKECDSTGYLAQHNLLDQIPELKDDICIPEYCYTSRNSGDICSTLEINAWFGPKGTVSSLHFDPKDNLLAQVYGTKLIILFSPKDSEYLYPHESQMLSNTSQVNPRKPNLTLFPKFANAKMYKCLLGPGDILYIPPKWWHYVVALDKSFSVNFWWS